MDNTLFLASEATVEGPATRSDVREVNTPISVSRDNIDTLSGWTVVSEAMTRYDEQTIADWKDDLANLLIFSGLFSSVVAGFTVESQTWLQQSDPSPSLQVQLLTQISAQLASFSISPGFINSTASPTLPLEVNTDSSSVPKANIRINTLWFLSLGLSLVASLFAIIVQQWLREYRLPGHLDLRERVRLRQYRYQSLLDWGVPQIISTLPVLLQIALILFLSGLCYLLFTLDDTVARAFIAFVGISLATYSGFMVLPIVFRRCPYKNPLAHSIPEIYQMILSLGGFIVLALQIFISYAISGVMTVVELFRGCRPGAFGQNLNFSISKNFVEVTNWRFMRKISISSLRVVSDYIQFIDSRREYWTARERNALPKVKHLEADALIWAADALSQEGLSPLVLCLQDLDIGDQQKCVISWVARAFNIDIRALDGATTMPPSTFTADILKKIDEPFARRFRDMLLSVLPDSIHAVGITEASYSPSVLVILRQIARTATVGADFTVPYTRQVVAIRGNQQDSETRLRVGWSRLPTSCLFECSTVLSYNFSAQEISSLFGFAFQLQNLLFPLERLPIIPVHSLEPLLVSAATALHAVSRGFSYLPDSDCTNDDLLNNCRALLVGLDRIIVKEKARFRDIVAYPDDWTGDGVLLCTNAAITTICRSLVALTEVRMLPALLDTDGDDVSFLLLVVHMADAFGVVVDGMGELLDCCNALGDPGI